MTIDELARHTGLTVRTIREHQSRGLLAPPELRGRVGHYGSEHVARIELIRDLREQGFNLEAIKRLLESANGSTGEVLGFTRAIRVPFAEERPEVLTLDQLAERWGDQAAPEALERAIALGLVRRLDHESVEIRSPAVGKAGRELAALGIPLDTALDLFAGMRERVQGIASAYVSLFLEEVWEPFEAAGRPQERWPEVREKLERLRPLATEALLGVFGLTMAEEIDRAFGRVLEPIAGEGATGPAAAGDSPTGPAAAGGRAEAPRRSG